MRISTKHLVGGTAGTLIGVAIAVEVLHTYSFGEIRCGINGINASIVMLILTVLTMGVAYLIRLIKPVRAFFGNSFFLSLFGLAILTELWINFIAPDCPFLFR